MRDQAQREAKLKRDFGTTQAHRENLRAFNAKQDDWYATCRVCGNKRTGTIAEITKPCTHEKS